MKPGIFLRCVILAGLLGGYGPGLPLLRAASPELVSIGVDTERLVAGQRFNFTIRLHDNGLAIPQAKIPQLDPRVALVSGPEITTETVVDETGRQGRFVFMRYEAKANSAGYAILPAITVQYGVQTLVTRPLLLAISRQDSTYIPPDLVWHVHSDRVFKGQSVFISLELVNCPTIVFPDAVEVPGLTGGAFEELKDAGRIESTILAGVAFQTIPLTGFMFTPGAAGTLALPIARVKLDKQPIQTQPQTLQVSELPAEAVGVSAIGELKLSFNLESSRIGSNGDTRLSVRLEGTGNLRSLQLPVPEVVGFNLAERLENSKLVATESGYRGYREAVYQISGLKPGAYQIYLPPCPVLGLDGKIRFQTTRPLTLTVGTDQASVNTGQSEGPIAMLGIEQLEAWGKPESIANQVAWAELIKQGVDAYAARDYTGAYDWLLRAVQATPGNPALQYNLGLACLVRGSPAEAIFYLQKAVRLAPGEALFRTVLAEHEAAVGLKRQLPILALPGLWWLLGGLVLGGIFLLGTLIAAVIRKKPVWWLGVGLSLVLLVLSGSAMGVGQWQLGQPVGVVAETGAVLKRIPEPQARDWLQLASGTTLWAVGRAGDFILVETAFGIKGWVDHSALYLPESVTGL